MDNKFLEQAIKWSGAVKVKRGDISCWAVKGANRTYFINANAPQCVWMSDRKHAACIIDDILTYNSEDESTAAILLGLRYDSVMLKDFKAIE